MQDLRTEERFRRPPLLTEHGVVSGMSCIIRGPGGEPWGVLGTHSTRRVDFTRDDVSFLSAVANILGHAVQRERAESALRESDRRKDEFIAVLSHELRNPLAPLRSAVELMRTGRDPGQRGEILAMMDRQVAHLVRLVDDLLEVSRISRGIVELKREPVRVQEVLRAAIETSEPLLREAGHELETELSHEPLWVNGDAVRLTQCFANLLNNAARYTAPGGRVGVRATRVPTGDIQVSVSDTGAGFSPEERRALFEMFSRGEGSLGLGIGLSLVRALVEMHGGSVEAHSQGPGRGSEFVVTLPPGQPVEATAAAPVTVPPASGLRVVVADDNHDAADSLAALLRVLGNDVAVVYGGVEAIEAARTHRPHLMLLDIGMPRLDGYGAARAIRKAEGGAGIELVALTGWGQEEDRRRAHEAGFDAHLVKPVGVDALRRLLAQVREQVLQDSEATPAAAGPPTS